MATKQFTLCLSDEAANRIQHIVAPYAGTVGGYAARFACDLSRLPTTDQEEIRLLICAKIRRLEEAALRDAPKIPASPTLTPAEAKTLHAQVSMQHPPTPGPYVVEVSVPNQVQRLGAVA